MGYYERIWRLCGNQIFNGLCLDDFVIRRDKFIRQEFDERVNLWLVVAITFSGVVLAALQLFMAYNLTVSGKDALPKDSELALESGKLSLKSSVTGLAILALSLAFFIVYVKYIRSYIEFCWYGPNPAAPIIQASGTESVERASIVRRQLR